MNLSQALISSAAAAALFTVGAAGLIGWAVNEKAARDAAPPVVDTLPTASQARYVCREFIDRRSGFTVAEWTDRRTWAVKAPPHGSNRWQVVAEFVTQHPGGVTTRHRMLCIIEAEPNGWKVRKLV